MPRIPHPILAPAFALALVLSAFSPAHAIKGLNPDGSLDKPTVSKAYFEGEFWTVINALEAFRKSDYKISREDSIYTFKYLSVVYAADPETRKKAESYMYQLLRMMPTIDLLDLYISDNIESIFKKVKSDYEKIEQSHQEMAQPPPAAPAEATAGPAGASHTGPAAAAAPAPAAPAAPARESKGMGLKPWVPYAVAGVGALVAGFVFLSLQDDSGGKSDVPRPVEITVVTPNQGSQ